MWYSLGFCQSIKWKTNLLIILLKLLTIMNKVLKLKLPQPMINIIGTFLICNRIEYYKSTVLNILINSTLFIKHRLDYKTLYGSKIYKINLYYGNYWDILKT